MGISRRLHASCSFCHDNGHLNMTCKTTPLESFNRRLEAKIRFQYNRKPNAIVIISNWVSSTVEDSKRFSFIFLNN